MTRKKIGRYLLIGLTLIFVLLARGMRTWIPTMLTVQDPLQQADAIVVLGGDYTGKRLAYGVELYQHKWADHLIFSGGVMQTWNGTEADIMRAQALTMGVPEQAMILENRSTTTYENAVYTLQAIQAHHWKSVIVVTDWYHSRRAKWIFAHLYKNQGIQVLSAPLQAESSVPPATWWEDHLGTKEVLTNLIGVPYYWLRYGLM